MGLLQHFGLSRAPFPALADPAQYVPLPAHDEALAALRFAAATGKALVVVTAPSGAGCTMLARRFADAPAGRPGAWLTRHGEVLAGAPRPGREAAATAVGFAQWVRQRERTPGRIDLIIDDGHALDGQTWNDVAALLADGRLAGLGVFAAILGHEELRERLSSAAGDPIRPRLYRHVTLGPLTPGQTRRYLHARLAAAGLADPQALLPQAAVERLHEQSGGLPGRLQAVAEYALALTYANRERTIDPAVIDQAARELASAAGGVAPHPLSAAEVLRYTDETGRSARDRSGSDVPGGAGERAWAAWQKLADAPRRRSAGVSRSVAELKGVLAAPTDAASAIIGTPLAPEGQVAALRVASCKSAPLLIPEDSRLVHIRPRLKNNEIRKALERLRQQAQSPGWAENRRYPRLLSAAEPIVFDLYDPQTRAVGRQVGALRDLSANGAGLLVEHFAGSTLPCACWLRALDSTTRRLTGLVVWCRALEESPSLYLVGVLLNELIEPRLFTKPDAFEGEHAGGTVVRSRTRPAGFVGPTAPAALEPLRWAQPARPETAAL